MEPYTDVAYRASRSLTLRYSSSFGASCRLLGAGIRADIFAIYGLVRIADEIVDTYRGTDALDVLDMLETETLRTIGTGYSPNIIVHAFAQTARRYGIGQELIAPFYASMRMDLKPHEFNRELYETYIHGSAEAVGLMCLRVFCNGDDVSYKSLRPGAAALGSAYQKVNFLRDIAADYRELGRTYFPDVNFETFDESDKKRITTDIRADFDKARPAISQLPRSSRLATAASYAYYFELLKKLESTPARIIKQRRIRIPGHKKLRTTLKTAASESLRR